MGSLKFKIGILLLLILNVDTGIEVTNDILRLGELAFCCQYNYGVVKAIEYFLFRGSYNKCRKTITRY